MWLSINYHETHVSISMVVTQIVAIKEANVYRLVILVIYLLQINVEELDIVFCQVIMFRSGSHKMLN